MSLEVELVQSDYDRRWVIHIKIVSPLAVTNIIIDEPYESSIDDWRKITGGDCAMFLYHDFSLDDGYYQFGTSSEYGTNFHTIIKEEILRDKLSKIIDKAVELNLCFGDDKD